VVEDKKQAVGSKTGARSHKNGQWGLKWAAEGGHPAPLLYSSIVVVVVGGEGGAVT